MYNEPGQYPYEDPWERHHRPRRRRGFGIFVVFSLLFIVLLLVGGAYMMNMLDIRLMIEPGGVRFTRGEDTASSVPFAPSTSVPTTSQPRETAQPQIGFGGGTAKVEIVDIPRPTPSMRVDSSGRAVLTISEIYERVAPSVVGIVAENTMLGYPSSGSGIVMTEDGYVITNNHVVSGADKITVVLENGEEYPAQLIGRDSQTDLAVIKAEAAHLQPAEFGNSDNMRPGDLAVAIGNPMGLDLQNTITEGIISAINRDLTIGNYKMTLLQISASVNPGNSGGPLINEYGQVIGIISSKLMGSYTSEYTLEGLGFAIPILSAAPILDELIDNGYVRGRPTIGIQNAVEVDAQSSRYFNYPEGIMVRAIHPDCDAAKQGLAVGDIITEVNGQAVKTVAEVNEIKSGIGAGGQLTVTVFRDGNTLQITFALMDEGELER